MRLSKPDVVAFAALSAIGACGVLSLLVTMDRSLSALPPEAIEAAGGRGAIKALLLVQPMLFVFGAAAVGLATAPRLSLRSEIVARLRGDANGPRPAFAIPALVGGLAAGAIIVGGDLLFAPWTSHSLAPLAVGPGERLSALATGLLYGGLTEELLVRWGLMSAIAWLLHRVGFSRSGSLVAAVLVAAGLFALGHLPALAQMTELTVPLVVRTLALNAAAGIVFGLIFARSSLEAAMAAHALTHVLIFFARLLGLAF
jgi:hypothetical protein